jgi:hypothetical protein
MPTHPLASPPLSLVCERSIPDDTPNLNEVPGKRLHRYFHINNARRPHQGLDQDSPLGLTVSTEGPIRDRNVLGGIIRDYYREAA